MVDLRCKSDLVSPGKSPKLSKKLQLLIPAACRGAADVSAASDSACSAYEQYLRLPELRKLWAAREFPEWKAEPMLRPALQALEITFRFISTVLSDSRPYSNQREWRRRLESLAASQIEIISIIAEEDEEESAVRSGGAAPVTDIRTADGEIGESFVRNGSSMEVWTLPGEAATAVSHTSEESLLPRLAAWQKSEDLAQKILYTVECQMRRCPYTLGIGEPNLAAKPSLDYDLICKPTELHALRKIKSPYDKIENVENLNLYTAHQILESWIYASNELLKRTVERIESRSFSKAAGDCYLLEKIWKLMEEIEDLHLFMDPDDFLRLMKAQLVVKSETAALCFRSRGLVDLTRACRDLKHKVPFILAVEVDPNGGTGLQEAAMKLYGEKREFEKVHLLQSLQAIEAALKRFFYSYKQVLVAVMGSLESSDTLSQVFLEPTYFPSLDAAKTFLGEMLSSGQNGGRSSERRGSHVRF